MPDEQQYYPRIRPVAGDNMPEWARPEVVAAEQRILTYADALVTWMRKQTWPEPFATNMVDYFMHTREVPKFWNVEPPTSGQITYILEKLDPDANRIFMDLLRAAWDRRCWRAHYGEIEETRRL